MITPTDLRAAGTYPPHLRPSWRPDAVCLWQIRVRDEDGATLYFVNFYEADPAGDFARCLPPGSFPDHAWRVDARLYLSEDGSRFVDVDYTVRASTTVDEVMDFYAQAYEALGCVPDALNN